MSNLTTACWPGNTENVHVYSLFLFSQSFLPKQKYACAEKIFLHGWGSERSAVRANQDSERTETPNGISCRWLDTSQFVLMGYNIVIYCISHKTSHRYTEYIRYIAHPYFRDIMKIELQGSRGQNNVLLVKQELLGEQMKPPPDLSYAGCFAGSSCAQDWY